MVYFSQPPGIERVTYAPSEECYILNFDLRMPILFKNEEYVKKLLDYKRSVEGVKFLSANLAKDESGLFILDDVDSDKNPVGASFFACLSCM